MTDEQLIKALRCWTGTIVKDEECVVCPFGEDCTLDEIVNATEKRLNELKSENAALRERLERSIELPCIEPMTTYDWDDEKGIGKPHFGERYQLLYRDEDGEFIAYIGLDKKEAEASLAELKGEKK